jgi:Fur family ferric uptake transcriptional regulator
MAQQRTRNQNRILTLLKASRRSLSAQEVYLEFLKQNQRIGLATIYRSLESLKRDGLIQMRTLTNGEGVYSSVQDDRHHLTCVECGESLAIQECPVHALEQRLQEHHHFKIYYHTLEFFGVCQQCQEGRTIVTT